MNLKEPANPLRVGYHPTGGMPHHVQNADTWWSLATKNGVDPWWLIQYNFETRDPAEVNWYLKHRVGCTAKTADGRNFVFSAAASPGIIYVPTPQMARSQKSLKYRKFGIIVQGDEDYRRSVVQTLDWLARSDTGKVLLEAIRATGKEIEVGPWTGAACNATAQPTNIPGATPAGEIALRGGSSFEQFKDPSLLREMLGLPKEGLTGTGKGSDAKVKFSPSMFGFGVTGACASFAGMPGASPSQILFHELAHAYRAMRGTFHTRPTVGSSTSYTNKEEFFAVVLSNILTADPTYSTGNRTLRADHAGFTALAPTLCTSRGFVGHTPNRNMMRELASEEPDLVKALRSVRSYFNPFVEPL